MLNSPQGLSATITPTPIASISATPTPKTMRKGTHSCIECRRRKIRCNWPKDLDKCNFCSTRKEKCIEQVYGDVRVLALRRKQRKKSGRERIDELARNISEVLERLDSKEWPEELALGALKNLQRELGDLPRLRRDTENAQLFGDNAETASGKFEDGNTGLSNAPLLSLFDNFLFSNEEASLEESLAPASSKGRYNRITKANSRILENLRALIPGRSALSLVLQANRVSLCLLQRSFPELPGLKTFLDDDQIDVLLNHMLTILASRDIAAVTKVVVCLATCFQQLPHDFDPGLGSIPAPLHVLEQSYVELAETILASDEGIVSSYTGIQCLLVQVRYFLNLGLPTKAWIIFRRALTFAQCLGGFQNSSRDRPNTEKLSLQFQLWNLDRNLSLLFGFPYATAHLQFNIESITPKLPTYMLFLYNLGGVATRIIDRNQQPGNTTFLEAIAMDRELEKCRQVIPASWWEATAETAMREEEIYEMFTMRLWYHNLRNLIYLPFSTKALANSENTATELAGLTASREVISCYEVLRDTTRPVLRICNLIDFQAFTAGMVIIIALLGQSSCCLDSDWEIISDLIRVLDRTVTEMPNGVATQASRLLRELCSFREREFDSVETFHAVVPYLGKMKFRIQKPFRSSQTTAADEFVEDSVAQPVFGLESYSQGFDMESWGNPGEEWTSMVDFGLQEDWSWNFDTEDLTIEQNTFLWQGSQ